MKNMKFICNLQIIHRIHFILNCKKKIKLIKMEEQSTRYCKKKHSIYSDLISIILIVLEHLLAIIQSLYKARKKNVSRLWFHAYELYLCSISELSKKKKRDMPMSRIYMLDSKHTYSKICPSKINKYCLAIIYLFFFHFFFFTLLYIF